MSDESQHSEDRRLGSRAREHDVDRRFEQIERAQGQLRDHVTKALHTIEMLGHDQASFGKLMEARFLAMERAQGMVEVKMDNVFREMSNLRNDIQVMASDVSKTPAGRMVEDRITQTSKDAGEARKALLEECRDLREKIESLESYRHKFEGAIWMLYVGAPSGIGALIWMVLKTLADYQPR